MDLAEAVAVPVAGIFAAGMADALVRITPGGPASVDVVFMGVKQRTGHDRCSNDWLDRGLLHIGQHAQHDLTAALDQPEDRWLVLFQRAASRRARKPAPPSRPPLFATSAGWPLCPATMVTSSTSAVPSSFATGARATSPDGDVRSSLAHPRRPGPVPQRSADWKGSAPSGRGKEPTCVAADDAWPAPCRSVSVCRRQALQSSTTRRLRRRARIEMNAMATKAMRCSFERSKIVFNRR